MVLTPGVSSAASFHAICCKRADREPDDLVETGSSGTQLHPRAVEDSRCVVHSDLMYGRVRVDSIGSALCAALLYFYVIQLCACGAFGRSGGEDCRARFVRTTRR